jgi:hypothetical protein
LQHVTPRGARVAVPIEFGKRFVEDSFLVARRAGAA